MATKRPARKRASPRKRAAPSAPKSAPEIVEASTRSARDETRDPDREESGRQRRVPMGSQQLKMQAEKRPGYVRYWFNDKGNRLRRAQDAGYSFVQDKDDQKRSMTVGTQEDGSPLRAYLMETPEDFYNEDQALKQVPLDEFERAINSGTPQGARPEDQGQFYQGSEAEGDVIQRGR